MKSPALRSPSSLGGSSGSVLIVVLVVCLGLVSLVLVFGHSMLMAYRGTDNELAGRQADQAIEGASRYAQYLLATSGTDGAFPLPTTYQNEAVPVGDAFFWFIGRPGDTDAADQPAFGLVDEASKLNINAATVEMLQLLPGMTPELAAAIIDWRDVNETPTAGGAESETYMLRQPSYGSKNAPFESVEELALVNGADMTILYGEDTNMNGVLDPNEDDGSKTPPDDNSDKKLDPGVLEYLTAYTREPNLNVSGSARINVSTAAAQNQPLRTMLSGTFGQPRAAEIQQGLGNSQPKSLLEFFIRSGMTEDEFDEIADDISVSNAQYIVGLVNVNTASEAVLACIPGIGPDNAPSLIAARANRATPATNVAWVASVLERQAAFQAGPYLTAQSWQVTADIAAVGRHGRGYRRTRFVIDKTGDTPKVVYRRNLAPLGWALGDQVRQTLAAKETEGR
jgi:DNA uptake protein ComE-like DNA-binding protein